MKANNNAQIIITRNGIDYTYKLYLKPEESGDISWYIPSFDIYYSSKDRQAGERKAEILTYSFFNYWIKQEGFTKFILQIHKLGFKANSNHNLVIKQLLDRKITKARLNSHFGKVPESFNESFEPKKASIEMAI